MNKNNHIPIYRQLAGEYRKAILGHEFPPGRRIDSISEIMVRHQVSRDTAKMVLKSLIEEGLVVSKTGKGSFVAVEPGLKKAWGMVIPFFSSNMETLLAAANSEAESRGRKLHYFLNYNSPEEEMKLVGRLIAEAYEAVIIVPNFNEALTADFYRRLRPGKTRIVLADHTMAGSWFNCVIQSYDLGVKRALDYLESKNQGNILLVKNEGWQGVNLLYDFMESSLRILVSEKMNGKEVFVIDGVQQLSSEYIQRNSIGGILASLDTDAVRVAGRLVKWGYRLPAEISLVSYGNTELLELFRPAVTAIDCLYPNLAQKIAEILMNKDSQRNPEQHVIQPVLIKRET